MKTLKPTSLVSDGINRETKENVIIEASLKSLDTAHLTQFIVRLMREQLNSQTPAQFEKNYKRASQIRQDDPSLFSNPPGPEINLEVLWVDRKSSLCSEQEKNIVFVNPEPPPAGASLAPTNAVKKPAFIQNLSSASN